jgi:hypothetical protein
VPLAEWGEGDLTDSAREVASNDSATAPACEACCRLARGTVCCKDTNSPAAISRPPIEAAMRRPEVVLVIALALLSSTAGAQSLSLTTANASGDCTGTSFYQAADAGGKYLAGGWAAPVQFPVGVNRGRVRCTLKFNVTMQPGFKLVPGGGYGNANRVANAQFLQFRLNGASSQALIESAISIDATGPATAMAMMNGGPATAASMALERPTGSPVFESVCSTAAKSMFQISVVLDAATASNYTIPWPPEPYGQREGASMGEYRLFYNVVPCATRSASTEGVTLRP